MRDFFSEDYNSENENNDFGLGHTEFEVVGF